MLNIKFIVKDIEAGKEIERAASQLLDRDITHSDFTAILTIFSKASEIIGRHNDSF